MSKLFAASLCCLLHHQLWILSTLPQCILFTSSFAHRNPIISMSSSLTTYLTLYSTPGIGFLVISSMLLPMGLCSCCILSLKLPPRDKCISHSPHPLKICSLVTSPWSLPGLNFNTQPNIQAWHTHLHLSTADIYFMFYWLSHLLCLPVNKI